VNKGERGNMNWALSRAKMEDLKIHASETAWVGTKFDVVLDNNGSIDELFSQVKDLVEDRLAATESLPYATPEHN
jgi:dephospho-CoA kinase